MIAPTAPLRVHTLIDALGWGGAESLLGDLAAGAPAAGIELSVGYLLDTHTPAAERIRACGIEPELVGIGRMSSPRSMALVRAHLARRRPDVLHTHLTTADFLGGVAARTLGIPSVSTIHVIGRAVSDAPGARGDAKNRLVALTRRHAAARVIAVSDAARDAYLRTGWDTPERVVTVHNGVARTEPTRGRAAVRAELGIAPDALVAVMVSVLRPRKGHEVAIEAVARLRERVPQLVLLVAGDGPSREHVEGLARPLGDAVVCCGHRHDVLDVIAASDLVLHPTHMDAFPTSLLEAGLAGLPVVATRVGGIPEIVVHGATGLLVDAPPAVDDVAAALERLALDPGLRGTMGAAARARYDREFDAVSWARRLRRVYDAVAGRSP